jgi:phosphoribulokinase
MSVKHPIIAITGSSGAGTTTTTNAIRHIFRNLNVNAASVAGDSFHRFTRPEMEVEIRKAQDQGRHISYFGPKANDFMMLEKLFAQYGETGTGQHRQYLHTFDEAVPFNQMPGTFTPWQDLSENTDLLFYEGLHGGVTTDEVDVAKHVDLLVGMVPIVNLEWIQKIIRDTTDRGHTREAVMSSIVRSLEDYFHYITPQFSNTHVNFQRVPTVDTSNPFSAREIPSQDESFVVVRFRREMKNVDFPYLLKMIDGAFMSRINTLVVPGGKMGLAMELILSPLIEELLERKRKAGFQMDWVTEK